MTIFIAPFMYDLAISNGKVVLGPGSEKACDKAIEEAYNTSNNVIILLSATISTNPRWQWVRMGKIAEEYIQKNAPQIKTDFHEARWFNTIGEVWALVEYLNLHPAKEVVIAVKWWHLPRTYLIVRTLMKRATSAPTIKFRPHWLPFPPLKLVLREFLGILTYKKFIRKNIDKT